jgi:hypothetical protein
MEGRKAQAIKCSGQKEHFFLFSIPESSDIEAVLFEFGVLFVSATCFPDLKSTPVRIIVCAEAREVQLRFRPIETVQFYFVISILTLLSLNVSCYL